MIVLDDGRARVEVHPENGAAIGRYDFIGPDGEVLPIFQTVATPGRQGSFAAGLNLLIPFSNRISGGGFRHDGMFYPLERNTADPYPIHGNAFTAAWTVRESAQHRASLNLVSDGPGPFRYEAEVTYALEAGALRTRLAVVNRAAMSLPFGAGLHPWFVRTGDTRLTMGAAGYWTETADHLPEAYLPTAGDSRFDFSGGRALPETFFNNALTGWDGRAVLAWPDRRLAVNIAAPPPLTTLILYSPSATANFVCIEPVSHSVDAHNRSDGGTALPQILMPGEALTAEAVIRPYVLT
jgi:aldose 1-epimerase